MRETNPEGRSYLIQIPRRRRAGRQHGGLCGAAALLLHDGRQSRQFRRQPLRSGPLVRRPAARRLRLGQQRRRPVGDEIGVGFVPEENLVGRARIVILSWKEDASIFKPWTWLDLRWNRFLRWVR